MLGKLLKHELRQTARSVMTIYIILAAVAGILLLSSVIGATLFKALSNVALFTAAIVMMIMTLVAIIKNFRETLYGRQGYLSFTLPVRCSSLLLSKILVSVFWLICAVALMLVVYVIMYLTMTGENGIELIGNLKDIIAEIGYSDLLPSKVLVIEAVILMGIWLLMQFIILIGFIYFSITMANTRALQQHPTLYGILIFFVSYFVVSTASRPLTEKVPLSLQFADDNLKIAFVSMMNAEATFSFGIAGLVFETLVAVALLVLTGWIMENKVNVK